MQKEIKLKFDAIRPFGPTVIKGKVPDNILNIVNKKCDEILGDPKLAKQWDWSPNLAGNKTRSSYATRVDRQRRTAISFFIR